MASSAALPLRVLVCLAGSPSYYDADDEERDRIKSALESAFRDLGQRFNVRVLGTLDDDLTRHGTGTSSSYRGYLLLDAADFNTVVDICDLAKQVKVGPYRLFKYVGVEALIGRQLPFVEA